MKHNHFASSFFVFMLIIGHKVTVFPVFFAIFAAMYTKRCFNVK